jgi:MFS family permease
MERSFHAGAPGANREGAPRPRRRTSPDFLKLWTAKAISELGSRITREGIPLTALLVLHASALQMGLLNALGGAAVLVVGLAAGVWIDRRRRRPVLIAADLGRAAVLASIPAAALAGRLAMGQLYAVAALAGVLTIFFDVADQSYLPTLVEPDRILDANAKLTLSSTLAEIAGPGLTGFLVQLITAPIAILFDALSFLVSALLLVAIRQREPPPERRSSERLPAQALAGVRWIFADPVLRALGLRSATAWVFHGFFGALYMLFAVDVLHLRPAVIGIVVATGGAGAMAGAFLAPRLERRFPLGRTFLAAAAIYGLTTLLIPLAGIVPAAGTAGAWPAAALLIVAQLGDMAFTVYDINEVSLRQRIVPPHVLGRVNAGMELLARGVFPLGALLGGYLGMRLGVRPTLALAAGGILLSSLWLAAPALRRLP